MIPWLVSRERARARGLRKMVRLSDLAHVEATPSKGEEYVAALEAAYRSSAEIPPIVLVHVLGTFRRVDGNHRLTAMRRVFPRTKQIEIVVIDMERRR